MQIILFRGLIVAVFYLIDRLKTKERTVGIQGMNKQFQKEKITLMIQLIIFASSYILRGIFDFIHVEEEFNF